VSTDELIFDENEGVAFVRILDKKLLEQFEKISNLKPHDKEAVKTILESVIIRSVMLSQDNDIIEDLHVKDAIEPGVKRKTSKQLGILDRHLTKGFNLDEILLDVDRHYLKKAWEESHNMSKAYKLVGFKNANTFKNRAKKCGIDYLFIKHKTT